MATYDFDLFVIGAGSGGVRAARTAAGLGVKVGVAEERYLGGTCVNVGCVPKKLYVYASKFAQGFKDAQGFGLTADNISFDWPTLRDNKTREISRLNGIYERLMADSGCTLIEGRAKIVDAHTVAVGAHQYTTERILVATGGWPHVPEFDGREHVITSNEIFDLEQFPQRLLIVGGGYIATEFAGIFAGLGCDVTLINRSERILKGFDGEVSEFVTQEMGKHGVDIQTGKQIAKVEKQADGSLLAHFKEGGSQVVDQILMAAGRVPNSRNIGLEEAGVELAANGAVVVDDYFQTSVPSIYAIGDVIDRMQLTPVALSEGMALVRHLYAGADLKMHYDLIPTAVFCQPNIGTVGLTEEAARERYANIDVYRSEFRPLMNTLSGNEARTLMKLLVDADSDRVVGVHMAGPDAAEIVQGLAVALKAGATKSTFDSTIGIHPTSAEEFVTMRTKAR